MNFSMLSNHVEPPGTPRRNLRSQKRPLNKEKNNVRVGNAILFYLTGRNKGGSRHGTVIDTSNFRLPAYPKNKHYKVRRKIGKRNQNIIVPVSLIKRVLKRH
jgi:hypothetical protein